jgi:hypothetical protein
MVEGPSELRVDRQPRSSRAALRAERPRPSDPGGDEDVPDDREIERGGDGERESSVEPQRNLDQRM